MAEIERPTSTPGSILERASTQARPFKVARVEKTSAPDGSDGAGWYRYVLDNGKSTITGQRAGSLKDVTAHAAHCAEQINARGFGKQSLWSPRGRKPANAPKPADVTGS
ncbi:MAG TPA: hypothetical protein VJ437_07520 [Acidiferrobacterales bacterium]|jgi:hypothetical protein|nr:hypothetical protein [Acidiferrobacterales bacterium]